MSQRAAIRLPFKALTGAALLGALLALTAGPAGAATAKQPAKPAAAKATTAKAKPAGTPHAGACYNRAEHAAEQLIRMHTEMMIVGLTCRTVVPEKKPFDTYQEFSVKNRALISGSEASMIGYYKRTGGGNATRNFDMYRTELANESSRRAATIGIPQYCATFVDRSNATKDLTPADLATLTSNEKDAGLMHLASKPLCDVKVVSGPDPVNYAVASAAPAPSQPARAKAPAKAATAKAPAKPKKEKVAAAPSKPTVAVR